MGIVNGKVSPRRNSPLLVNVFVNRFTLTFLIKYQYLLNKSIEKY